jgi:hypothetical protein
MIFHLGNRIGEQLHRLLWPCLLDAVEFRADLLPCCFDGFEKHPIKAAYGDQWHASNRQ